MVARQCTGSALRVHGALLYFEHPRVVQVVDAGVHGAVVGVDDRVLDNPGIGRAAQEGLDEARQAPGLANELGGVEFAISDFLSNRVRRDDMRGVRAVLLAFSQFLNTAALLLKALLTWGTG